MSLAGLCLLLCSWMKRLVSCVLYSLLCHWCDQTLDIIQLNGERFIVHEEACFPQGGSGNRWDRKWRWAMNHRAYPSVTYLLQTDLTFQRFPNIFKQYHQSLTQCLNTWPHGGYYICKPSHIPLKREPRIQPNHHSDHSNEVGSVIVGCRRSQGDCSPRISHE